jgi:photosystem II stability/assembly factor-like uncharacterized protein
MNLKLRILTIVYGICSGFLFINCSSDNTTCGGASSATRLIKGPSPGQNLNNSDNPFRALAIHPTDPNTIYVGSEGNGIFKSDDGGSTWTWLREGLRHCDAYPEIYSIAINSSDPDQLIIATNAGPGSVKNTVAGVYKSSNAGNTWTQFNQGLPNSDINAAIIISGSHFLVGLGSGQSTNSGDNKFYKGGFYTAGFTATSWSPASAPLSAQTSIYWQIIKKSTGLMAFGGVPTSLPTSGESIQTTGVLKSVDGGLSWTSLSQPLVDLAGAHIEASEDLQTIYADIRSGESAPTFYKSVDGGVNWTNPVSVSNDVTGPIKIIGANPNVVVAGLSNTIVRTTDGFATITTVMTAPDNDFSVMAIEVSPSDSNIIYATTKGLLVYKSVDAGLNFTQVANLRLFIDLQP